MDKTSIRVQIGGQWFNIVAGQKAEEVQQLASDLDSRVNAKQKTAGITYIQAVVLAALDCEEERQEALSREEQLRNEIRGYLTDTAKAKTECERLKRENERLKAKLQKKESPGNIWQ